MIVVDAALWVQPLLPTLRSNKGKRVLSDLSVVGWGGVVVVDAALGVQPLLPALIRDDQHLEAVTRVNRVNP